MAASSDNSFVDRSKADVLLVTDNRNTIATIRQALKTLGYGGISSTGSHVEALERFRGRNFSHCLFDASNADMPTELFVTRLVEMDPDAVLVAVSSQPDIDDVFGLLRSGARGFLVPPFNLEVLEQVIELATEKPMLSEAVLNAPDRNAAFASIILNNLYRLAVAKRQSAEFASAAADVVSFNQNLRESIDLGCLFCEGGVEALRDKIVEGCIERAHGASTRLGRLRKRLRKDRLQEPATT